MKAVGTLESNTTFCKSFPNYIHRTDKNTTSLSSSLKELSHISSPAILPEISRVNTKEKKNPKYLNLKHSTTEIIMPHCNEQNHKCNVNYYLTKEREQTDGM